MNRNDISPTPPLGAGEGQFLSSSPSGGGRRSSPPFGAERRGLSQGWTAPWRHAARGWLGLGQVKPPRVSAAAGGKSATATSRKRRGRGRVLATSLLLWAGQQRPFCVSRAGAAGFQSIAIGCAMLGQQRPFRVSGAGAAGTPALYELLALVSNGRLA